MPRAKKDPTFEKDLEQLEKIVEALEEGGLSLDDSLKHFEQGIKLSRRCEKALTEAEKKIQILTKNADGELEAQDFGDDASDDEADDSDDEDEGPPEEEGELLF
jgi:exodeoxyribonuclease VII small subunit